MVRAELKNLMCGEFDLRTYVPDTPDVFGFWVELEIGIRDCLGADLFEIFVCTPKWLERKALARGPAWHRGLVVVLHFDFNELELWIQRMLSGIEGRDWKELSAKLRLIARWEFDDSDLPHR